MRRRRFPKQSRGFLMIMGLFVITTALTLTAVGLTQSMTELLATNRFVASTQAFHLAEAAIDEAAIEYRVRGGTFSIGNGWSDVNGDPCIGGRACLKQVFTGATTATVTVNDITLSQPTITATGSVTNSASGTVTRRLSVIGTTTPPTFSHAFFAGKYLKIGSWGPKPVTTDSFDSSLGSYNQDLGGGVFNKGSNGTIGTNGGTIDNPYLGVLGIDLKLQATANINGMVTTTPWITDAQIGIVKMPAPGAQCKGPAACDPTLPPSQFTKKPPLDLPPINFPQALTDLCQGVTPTTIPTVSSGVRVLSSGGCYGSLTVNGTGEVDIPVGNVSVKSVTIQGDGKLIMPDDTKLLLRGDGTNSYVINITNTYDADGTEHGGSLITARRNEIYAQKGQVWVRSKNGIIPDPSNTSLTPRDLIIRAVGRDTNLDTSTGTPSGTNDLAQPFFQGAFYLQHGWLYVKGNYYCPPSNLAACAWTPAEHYGAVVSGEYLDPATHGNSPPSVILPDDPLTFHYDESLQNVPLAGLHYFKILIWREPAPNESS